MRRRPVELVTGPTAVEMLGSPTGLTPCREWVELELADYVQLLLGLETLEARLRGR